MYLGIDLGTSELKVVLLDEGGALQAAEHVRLAVSRPHPGWSEQSPHDWWAALQLALDALYERCPSGLRALRGIGLSGQMHGAVLLGAQDAVLRPVILCNDNRSAPQCEVLRAADLGLEALAGNRIMPGFTAPKLLWVREHEPEVFSQVSKVLLPKDYLRLQLTGDYATDCSDASGTLWLDVAARDWSERALAACDLGIEHMPLLYEGSAPTGTVRPEWCQRWGIPRDAVVAAGAGDNAASAMGLGAIDPGEGFVSLGTSGVIFLSTAQFQPKLNRAVHAFCHALPHRWHQMSVMLSAASALTWAVRATGQQDAAALLALVSELSPLQRQNAPVFLPYLSGERTPHDDPYATGALVGLLHDHGPAEIGWAVLEGVSFGLLDGWRSLDSLRTAGTAPLGLVGGGGRSILWATLLATVLEQPLIMRQGGDLAAARGAARLGWLAADGSPLEVFCSQGEQATMIEPDPRMAPGLLARYARFCQLYPALRAWRSAS